MLFRCQWADTTRDRGFRKDAWNFDCVNFSRLIHTGEYEDHDPYIEASQARMVYYVVDENDKEWSVVVHVKPRDIYDMGEPMGEPENEDVHENEPYQEQILEQFFDTNYEHIQLARAGVDEDENDQESE
ncbi:hypothetical protein Tsubulata_009187 [Turnera subulata]|uniref:DUF4216 domain-containing protein n=1 Tax=Turnera subulata TaxID=218843 RepID=A0A9Q0FKJ9_9ROSI|nr:hypothetical protein Tsubulata_009187 [Turnera subulata]